jgi:hypothetical protein
MAAWWDSLKRGMAANPVGAVATGAGAALNLAKGIWGVSQYRKGKKEYDNLMSNMPVYKRPEEYEQELAYRKQQAAKTEPAWYQRRREELGSAFAQGIQDMQTIANGSSSLMKGYGNLFTQRTQAEQDLADKALQWNELQQENLSQTRQRGAGYSDQEFAFNQLQPWEMKTKDALSNKTAGLQNMFGGFEGALGNVMDFAGTTYMQKILEVLKKK